MKSIMLDTNAYSSYRRGNEDVLEALARAERVFMSVFVLGELLYGFRRQSASPEPARTQFLSRQAVGVRGHRY